MSSERFKGLYNLTFSPNSDKEQPSGNQIAIMGYMNEKIKSLEIENSELKKEISMKSQDSEKMDYYLRLRRDLLEEVERLKNEKASQECKYTIENEKMQEEINSLTLKLKTAQLKFLSQRTNDEDFISTTTERTQGLMSGDNLTQNQKSPINKASGSKYFRNILDKELNPNFTDENFFIQPINSNFNFMPSNSSNNNTKREKEQSTNIMYFSTLVPNTEENVNSKEVSSGMTNPFLAVITDLEERIKMLETALNQRNQDIDLHIENELKNKFETEAEIERLQKEIDAWKHKYHLVLTTKKTMSMEYQDHFDSKSDTFKKDSEKTIYEREKKIFLLEKMNEKYEEDFEKLSKMNADSENAKQAENEGLKLFIRSLIDQYEGLYKQYEDNLKNMTKQIDAMKQLYSARESEFINITNYYTETIQDYSKPIADMSNLSNQKAIEDNLLAQTKEVEELRTKNESVLKELGELKLEFLEAKPKMRLEVSVAMGLYEDNISTIHATHDNLGTKLEKISTFIKYFESKFIFFNSLAADNKKLLEKVNEYECQLKMLDQSHADVEIFGLKEECSKLQRELEGKINLIKEYENEIPKYKESFISSTKSIKRGKETVADDVVLKLKSEIALLKNNLAGLNKSKDGIEKFYQVEIRNLMGKTKEKNEKIEDLLTIIKKLESDLMGKKETIFNLFMLEFKEFKENLITISDIKTLIDKFKIIGEELSEHKDRVYSEELYLLRQEMKAKDDSFAEMKNYFDVEKQTLLHLIDNYKITIDDRVRAYDIVLGQKKMELLALKNEKERLEGIENVKKNVNFI